MSEENMTPTWGYHATEPAQVFDLKRNEDLPEGWEDTPAAFLPGGKRDPAKSAKPALEAKHVGGGSYFIMDGDNRVGDAMKKEDAEAFNALSDAEKAAFVKKA